VLDNDAMTPEQKRSEVVRVVTNLIMAGAMLAVSHGQLKEWLTKLEGALGKTLAKEIGDEACMTLAMLDNATLTGLVDERQARRAAPHLEALDGRSVASR
jgi:hypothetical protein